MFFFFIEIKFYQAQNAVNIVKERRLVYLQLRYFMICRSNRGLNNESKIVNVIGSEMEVIESKMIVLILLIHI